MYQVPNANDLPSGHMLDDDELDAIYRWLLTTEVGAG
jgi:hypothetical protein